MNSIGCHKLLLSFITSMVVGVFYAQNLVPNPSFEMFNSCPTDVGQINNADYWDRPAGHEGTPDFFHTCATYSSLVSVPKNLAGFSAPYHGDAYVGLLTYYSALSSYREYVQTQLYSPMIENGNYRISLRVKHPGNGRGASNNIGVYISSTPLSANGFKPFIEYAPQIEETDVVMESSEWILVWGTYRAKGGESYITIGNFRNDAAITIQGSNLAIYYFIDSVNVELINERLYIPNAFTMNADGLNDVFKPSMMGVKDYSFLIFNRWGQKLFETTDLNAGWDGTSNGRICQQDVYVYKINYIDEVDNKVYSHVGRVTLLR